MIICCRHEDEQVTHALSELKYSDIDSSLNVKGRIDVLEKRAHYQKRVNEESSAIFDSINVDIRATEKSLIESISNTQSDFDKKIDIIRKEFEHR